MGVKNFRLSEDIQDRLKDLVLSEELGPDGRLPSEHQLASRFGASRATVREALRGLETSGLIVVRRGAKGGPFVAPRDLGRAGKNLLESLRAQRTPIEQLAEARLIVEPVLAELASDRASPEELRAIEKTLHDVRARLDGGRTPVLGNIEFHRLVARASGNAVLVIVLDACLGVLENEVKKLAIERPMVASMLRAHEAIFEALSKGHGKKAFRLMAEHVREAHRGLVSACLL